MRVAILGGTFNPPHLGHLFFANEVRQNLKYDKIIFVPTAISAHKNPDQNITELDRLKMLMFAIEDVPWAAVSDCDNSRGGVTRTIDTISDIIKEYSLVTKPGFIIGDDLLEGFSRWKDPEIITERADLIVGNRGSSKIEFKYDHKIVSNKLFPLSSTEIRDRVRSGKSIEFIVPKRTIEYIDKNELYR